MDQSRPLDRITGQPHKRIGATLAGFVILGTALITGCQKNLENPPMGAACQATLMQNNAARCRSPIIHHIQKRNHHN